MTNYYTDKRYVRINTDPKNDFVLVRELATVVDKLPNGAKITEVSLNDGGDLFIVLRTDTGEFDA